MCGFDWRDLIGKLGQRPGRACDRRSGSISSPARRPSGRSDVFAGIAPHPFRASRPSITIFSASSDRVLRSDAG